MNILSTYTPPGPVSATFLAAQDPVAGILGPVGSGKTSACIRKLLLIAALQQPSPRDGVRRTRVGVFRNTYAQLKNTTMRSWFDLIPQGVGRWHAEDRTHQLTFDSPRIELEVIFLALDRPEDAGKLKGLEIGHGWLNEAVEFPWESVEAIMGRTNRYPAMRDGGCTNSQVLMDTNAPDTDSWWFQKFEEAPPAGWRGFRQPGGLDPAAENLLNLPGGRGYYGRLANGKSQWWQDVFIHAKYAYSQRGKPVFSEYNDRLHCAASDLPYTPGLPVIVGLDSDGHPAASFWQRPGGQWRGLAELYLEGAGPVRFGEAVRRLAAERFPGATIIGRADPSAGYGADRLDPNDLNWIERFAKSAGFAVRAAATNLIHPRLEAWRVPLTRLDAGQPGLIISPCMRMTRKGLAASYRYTAQIQPGGATSYTSKPEKNEFSHVIDAGGYALLDQGGYADVQGRDRTMDDEARRHRPTHTDSSYDPLS